MLQKKKLNVTNKNRDRIIYDHAKRVSESMDMGTLIAFARDTIEKNFKKLSNKEVAEIIGEFNPQVLEKSND